MNLRRVQRLVVALCMAFAVVVSGSQVDSAQNTVHVKGYTKKDGTVVKPHDRKSSDSTEEKSSSSTKTHKKSTTTPSTPSRTSTAGTGSDRCNNCDRDEHGTILRSGKAKTAFQNATGYSHGRPGYVIDHIVPLACGGQDIPSNMQWQTTADAKAKDKVERANCR